MKTEQDALLHLCPFHVKDFVQPTGYCHGSECMAWRWEYVAEFNSDLAPKSSDVINRVKTAKGYCGLVKETRNA